MPSPANCNINNMYGPTEGTIITSVQKIDGSTPDCYDDLTSIPIGLPVANNEYLVLDENMTPCAIGEGGELYISGDGIAGGYL